MAQIGTFTRNDDGSFAGVIKTLNLNVKVRLILADKESDKSPDLRALAGANEIGARSDLRQPRRERGRICPLLVALRRLTRRSTSGSRDPAKNGGSELSCGGFTARRLGRARFGILQRRRTE